MPDAISNRLYLNVNYFLTLITMTRMLFRYMMKQLSFTLILFATLSCRQSFTGDILIENVNIIDVKSGSIVKGQDVVINGNKITKITEHYGNNIHSGIVVNGRNKYLIPGLWDMHVHMMRNEWYKSQMPLLRANGITGFREMWGDLKIANYVKSQMLKDSLPYFRFVAPGHILDGKIPYWDNSIPVASTGAAIRSVDSLINSRADFIKVYSFLHPDVFHAIAQRCKENNFPFAGHVPHTVRLTAAARAGMASMEHLYGFLAEACSNSDSAMALMELSVKAFEAGNTKERNRIGVLFHSLVLDNFSEQKLKATSQVLKANNTYVVPTLATLRGIYFINDTSFTNDPRTKYMSEETLEYWKEVTESDLKKNTEVDWQHKRKRWQVEQQIMRILIAENVPIMAGTDSDNPYAFPGFSLHDEMALYVELGMTPIDALRSATTVPARFLNMADSLGSIEEGKLADLVLLNANPLENIRNTTTIDAVIANGKLYSKSYIDSILKRY